jgi:hypothetical protein
VAGSNALLSSLPKILKTGLAITTMQADAELANTVFAAERAALQLFPYAEAMPALKNIQATLVKSAPIIAKYKRF